MSVFAETARECSYYRGLKSGAGALAAKKPHWRLEVIEDVILEAAREGAAITLGQILVEDEDGLRPLPWDDPIRAREDFLGIGGPSSWRCVRAESGERWNDFVQRSTSHAITQVRELVASRRYGALAGKLFVDLAWVTEDELALFDLPATARERLRETVEDGVPFRPDIRAKRVWFARPVLGSFHGRPTEDIDAIPADARFAFVSLRTKNASRLSRLAQLEVLECFGVPDKCMPFVGAQGSVRVLSLGDVRIKSLTHVQDLPLIALCIGVGRQLQDWGALERLQTLRMLEIGQLWLKDLAPITAARGLRGLNIYAPRAVASLAPLSVLTELRALRFWGSTADETMLPLGALRMLRTLELRTGSFKLDAFAELAAALPDTAGPHRSPFKPAVGWQQQIVRCRKCGAVPEFYTLGKPTRLLCGTCDSARISKYVARWEILVSAARARHSAVTTS